MRISFSLENSVQLTTNGYLSFFVFMNFYIYVILQIQQFYVMGRWNSIFTTSSCGDVENYDRKQIDTYR